MTKQILTLVFLILAAATFAAAQTVEQQVGKIRQLSTDTNKQIDEGLEDKTSGFHYAAMTIGGERDGQQWSAVGTMETRDEFYFVCESGQIENCGADMRKNVRKIVSSYKAAADLSSNSEFLFNEAGELVFVFKRSNVERADGATVEQRYYFHKNKLIRIVQDGKTRDKFSGAEISTAGSEQAQAKRLTNLFALMFAD